MNLREAAGGLSRFAHLTGISRAPKAALAEDDDKKKDDDAKAGAAEDEDEDEKKKDDAKAAKAEDGDDDKDDKKDDDTKAAGPRDGFQAGIEAERGRVRAILGSKEAALNVALAAELICSTDLQPKQAIALMATAAATSAQAPAPRRGLDARMEGNRQAPLGAGGGAPAAASDPKAMAAEILATHARMRGNKGA